MKPAKQELPKPGIKPLRYRMIREVGRGSFGVVCLAEASDKRRVAVKQVRLDEGREAREVEMLARMHHPCIVPLLDCFKSSPSEKSKVMSLVMEFFPASLHKRIGGKPLPVQDMQCFAFQLLRALAYLDGIGIMHRDVKPENALVGAMEGLSTLKLADFGSAKDSGKGPSSSYICSRWWRAPELILGSSHYSSSVDWWSCGCVIAEMMLGSPLFRGKSSWGQMYEIIHALGTPSMDAVRALSSGAGGHRLADHLVQLANLQP